MAVYLPFEVRGSTDLTKGMVIGVVVDLIVILSASFRKTRCLIFYFILIINI
jgi:hypothetical protein